MSCQIPVDTMIDTDKAHGEHVEVVDNELSSQKLVEIVKVMGTVKLTEDQIVYIPTPTADPRGTANTKMESNI